MTAVETAFADFDAAWERVDHDLWAYTGHTDDSSSKSRADKKRELVASLRNMSNAASELAAKLDSDA